MCCQPASLSSLSPDGQFQKSIQGNDIQSCAHIVNNEKVWTKSKLAITWLYIKKH